MTRNRWEIITTIMRLSNTIEPMLAKQLTNYGIGLTDLRLLIMIRLHADISQKMLAAKAGLSQGVVSNRLDRMEHAGAISRRHVGGRLVAVELTDVGRDLLEAIVKSLDGMAPINALQNLSADEQESIVQGIRRVVQVLGAEERLLDESAAALEGSAPGPDIPFSRLGSELDDLMRAYIIFTDKRDSPEET